MKKIYLSPAIESLEVRAAFAICDPSVPGDKFQNQPGYDPFNPAPGRKPF